MGEPQRYIKPVGALCTFWDAVRQLANMSSRWGGMEGFRSSSLTSVQHQPPWVLFTFRLFSLRVYNSSTKCECKALCLSGLGSGHVGSFRRIAGNGYQAGFLGLQWVMQAKSNQECGIGRCGAYLHISTSSQANSLTILLWRTNRSTLIFAPFASMHIDWSAVILHDPPLALHDAVLKNVVLELFYFLSLNTEQQQQRKELNETL